MVANEHGDWKQYDHYEVQVRSTPHRGGRAAGVLLELVRFIWSNHAAAGAARRLTGGQDLQSKVGLLIDFAGDQVRKATLATCISRPEFCLCNSCCLFGVCLTQVRKFSQRRLEHPGVDKHNYLHDAYYSVDEQCALQSEYRGAMCILSTGEQCACVRQR